MPTVKPKLEFYLEESKNLAEYVKKYKPKIVHNVDTVLSTIGFGRQHRDFEKYYFAQMFGNFETLRSMTSTAGELAQLTNKIEDPDAPLLDGPREEAPLESEHYRLLHRELVAALAGFGFHVLDLFVPYQRLMADEGWRIA